MNLCRLSTCLGFTAAALLTLWGCNQTVVLSSSSTAGASSPSSASSGGSSSGANGVGSSTGSVTGSSGGSSSAGSSGTTTGAPLTFVDGGFVVCGGGDAGGGHPTSWLCPAGTYFCDAAGNPGNCFQCLSDVDCRDQRLPTYDPLRLRCDRDSGSPGYQNFCQQCLDSSDCDGNAAGAICDVNPMYPVNAVGVAGSSLEPPIETLGFETCEKLQVDCRLDGGPDCLALGQRCDPSSGICAARAGTCSTDQDCAGLTSKVQIGSDVGAILLPYCVNGACNACDGGSCPMGYCQTDADCGNPIHSASGLICDTSISSCVCTRSSQCAGFFPACTQLDGGNVDDAGAPVGFCGCSSDADCGDGGLACLPGTYIGSANAGFCGLPCTAPDFSSCAAFLPGSVCDPVSGLCSACTTNLQCAQDPRAGGPRCSTLELGAKGPCGCLSDPDCSAGWSCEAPTPLTNSSFFSLGVCTPAMSRCTPSSCGGYFCDWKDGGCANGADVGAVPSCLDDFDCLALNFSSSQGPLFCVAGACAGCRSNADCRAIGQAGEGALSATYCCQAGSPDCPNANVCSEACRSDADCAGNLNGTGCMTANGTTQCGCNTDQDCAGVANSPHCDLQSVSGSHTCECAANTDCPAGETCQLISEEHSQCTSACATDSDCLSGFFCNPAGICLPRCDMGHTCQAPDLACDVGNFFGNNDSPELGAVWCYACLRASDCGDELGCDSYFNPPFCDRCGHGGLGSCGSNVCVGDGLCHPTCEAGPCPAGQMCDTLGLAGNGANVCYGCVTAADCPAGEGCDHVTHTCGTCEGPTASGAPSDCPPDAVCSNYWGGQTGACLPNCDRATCPADRPICATFPSLTSDHAYCFGCLSDADCSDAGPGTWCDTSVDLTFTCRPAP